MASQSSKTEENIYANCGCYNGFLAFSIKRIVGGYDAAAIFYVDKNGELGDKRVYNIQKSI